MVKSTILILDTTCWNLFENSKNTYPFRHMVGGRNPVIMWHRRTWKPHYFVKFLLSKTKGRKGLKSSKVLSYSPRLAPVSRSAFLFGSTTDILSVGSTMSETANWISFSSNKLRKFKYLGILSVKTFVQKTVESQDLNFHFLFFLSFVADWKWAMKCSENWFN